MSLTEDEVRSLLRECVTVVKPGETLVFSPADPWTPNQMREFQDYANLVIADLGLDMRVLALPSGSLGIAEPRKFESHHVGMPCSEDGTCGCPASESPGA